MKPRSILNDVLGPVMREPSSSYTAGPCYIGTLARALLGGEPASVRFSFDPNGSFAEVYRQQGSALGFAAGVMGWSITEERFPRALGLAASQGLEITFHLEQLSAPDHPSTVEIWMTSRGSRRLHAVATSGAFVCADLILGGYINPIPLDETLDAVLAVGQMVPRELKCTAFGGLFLAPSAMTMPRQRQ